MTPLNPILSGDNTLGHVGTASTIACSLMVIGGWGLSLAGVPTPPTDVSEAFTILLTLATSYAMQRMAA